MKKLVLFFLFYFVLIFSSVFSVDLQTVCNSLSKYSVTDGDFTQTKNIVTSKGERTLKSSGYFVISPLGIAFDIKTPFKSVLVITQNSIKQTLPDGSISFLQGKDNAVFNEISKSLTGVFNGNIKGLSEAFNITFNSNDKSYQIELEPNDDTVKNFLNFIVLSGKCEENSCTLDSIKIVQNKESSVLYEFFNQNYSFSLENKDKSYF